MLTAPPSLTYLILLPHLPQRPVLRFPSILQNPPCLLRPPVPQVQPLLRFALYLPPLPPGWPGLPESGLPFALPWRPSITASAIFPERRRTALMASSFRGSHNHFIGVTVGIYNGDNGIPSFLASVTAIRSFRGSTTKIASGSRFISLTPLKNFSRRARSFQLQNLFFAAGKTSRLQPFSIFSLSTRERIVAKLVNIPPSHRWQT